MAPLQRKDGQTLVSVMVGMGVMAIGMLAFTSMITSQQRETQALAEKLGALELERSVALGLSRGNCPYELNNPVVKTFNSTDAATRAASKIELATLHSSSTSTSPVLAKKGQRASPNVNSLFVSAIELRDFVLVSGNVYHANYVIGFDQSKLIRPLKAIAIPAVLAVDSTIPAATRIVACGDPSDLQCPAGMTTIPKGVGNNSFCIDTGVQDSGDNHHSIALTNCNSRGLSLCSVSLWVAACKSGLVPGIGSDVQWTSDFGGWDNCGCGYGCASTISGAGCNGVGWSCVYPGPTTKYRCCSQ